MKIMCTELSQIDKGAIYFLKAEDIIQVMNSTVKDTWGVGSSLNLSPIKVPIQYKRKPLNIYGTR
jgi:hypothetical protein